MPSSLGGIPCFYNQPVATCPDANTRGVLPWVSLFPYVSDYLHITIEMTCFRTRKRRCKEGRQFRKSVQECPPRILSLKAKCKGTEEKSGQVQTRRRQSGSSNQQERNRIQTPIRRGEKRRNRRRRKTISRTQEGKPDE